MFGTIFLFSQLAVSQVGSIFASPSDSLRDTLPKDTLVPLKYRPLSVTVEAPSPVQLGKLNLKVKGFKDTLQSELSWDSLSLRWNGQINVPENGAPESWYVEVHSQLLSLDRSLGFFNVGSALRPDLRSLFYQIEAFQVPALEVLKWGEVSGVKLGRQIWSVANQRSLADQKMIWCYGDQPAHCDSLGSLYTWSAALALPQHCSSDTCQNAASPKNYQGMCPVAWHVPRRSEWEELIQFAGGPSAAARILKGFAPSPSSWNRAPFHEGNPWSFSLIPAGYRYTLGSFEDSTKGAYFWTASEYNGEQAWMVHLEADQNQLLFGQIDKEDAFSLRCVKD